MLPAVLTLLNDSHQIILSKSSCLFRITKVHKMKIFHERPDFVAIPIVIIIIVITILISVITTSVIIMIIIIKMSTSLQVSCAGPVCRGK